MNSFTFSATTCSVPVAPAPILSMVQSRTGRTPTTKHTGRRTIRTRIAAAVGTLAGWLPMSVSSTPSAQAISTLSHGDRLGERR